METATNHCYIIHNPAVLGGEATIKGTRTPVRAVVENWRLGLSPEEIVIHLPHITLAQVFDALSYYSDHQKEVDVHIEENKIKENSTPPICKMTSLYTERMLMYYQNRCLVPKVSPC